MHALISIIIATEYGSSMLLSN